MVTPSLQIRKIALTLGVDDALPHEFRLFARGWNPSEKGSFLFDDAAAASVIAEFNRAGVDLAIDLEHQMLLGGDSPDPTARDARGWCKLAIRNGELWAVDVKWTPDGAERLSQKRQRYVSPAFVANTETKRVEKIMNVAITAMPATHKTPALVAASVTGGCMDPKLVASALDALEKGDAKAALEILKGLIATAASGGASDPDAATEDAPPPAGDGGADETTESAAPPVPPDPADEENKKTAVAATARIVRLSGKTSIIEALSDVETWRTSHLALESERQALASERATLESAERRQGCADLVRLAGRAPSTVWSDDSATTAKKYLASMSLSDFREYVSDAIKSAPPKGSPRAPTAPVAGKQFMVEGRPVTLSDNELAICAETKCEPQTFAMLKARRTTA